MVRAQRNYLRTVEERARDLEAGRDLLAANVRDQERRRIAREMHDALAHRLSLLSVHAGALELRPDLSAEQIRTMAGVISDTSHLALEDLQDVIGLLGDYLQAKRYKADNTVQSSEIRNFLGALMGKGDRGAAH